MRFAVRSTSRDRSWTGIEATLADSFGGFAEAIPAPNHHLSMHVGAPVAATCRHERTFQRRLQLPGDIDVLPPGSRAVWHDAGPTSILVVRLRPALMRSAAEAMNIDIARVEIVPQLQVRDARMEHIIWALKAELESDERYDRLYAEGLGFALATHLLRTYSDCKATSKAEPLSKRRLERVIEYIHAHLGENLSLAQVAEVAAVSPTYLKAQFKQATGMPIHQYVMHRRVEYAIGQLLACDVPLSQLAQNAGFANQSHMAKCMKKIAGFTPGSVRQCPIVSNTVQS